MPYSQWLVTSIHINFYSWILLQRFINIINFIQYYINTTSPVSHAPQYASAEVYKFLIPSMKYLFIFNSC